MNGTLLADLTSPVMLLAVALVAMVGGWGRLVRVALAGFVLLGMPIVASLLLTSLPPAATPDGTPAAIVVLAGDNPELVNPGGQEPEGNTLERLRTAATLHRRTLLPVLVTGGQATHSSFAPQAVAMATSLQTDFAIPVRWTESRSHNLWQSTSASAAMLQSSGIDHVYLVADRWEEALVSRIYRRAGIGIVVVSVLRPKQMIFAGDGAIPRAITWMECEWAIRQWAGLACDAVRPCRRWMSEE